ncbi:MAG: twin-arginine translocation signal domain-containing protein, partial [Tepidisphaeraceae bacterium]
MITTNRREFLALSAAAGLGLAAANTASAAMQTTLHKAKIIGKVDEKTLAPLKAAGFEGVETTAIVSAEEAARGREIAEKMGMRVHGVLRGWAEFNNKDEAKAARTLETTEAALKAAAGYGASTVLLVPC